MADLETPEINILRHLLLTVRPGQVDIKAKRDSLKLHQWNQIYRNQKHNVTISLKALEDIDDKKEEETEDKVCPVDLRNNEFSSVVYRRITCFSFECVRIYHEGHRTLWNA